MKKKILKITISITLFLVVIYQFGDLNYTYIMIDGELYVLTHQMMEDEVERSSPTEIGEVEKKILLIFTPKKDNVSNGVSKGTKVYKINEDSIMIKYKDKNYCLTNKNEANLANGAIIRLR